MNNETASYGARSRSRASAKTIEASSTEIPLTLTTLFFEVWPERIAIRCRGEADLQNAVEFARDGALRRARLNAHGESHSALFCSQFDQDPKKTTRTALAASERTSQRIRNENPANTPRNSNTLSNGLMRCIDQ